MNRKQHIPQTAFPIRLILLAGALLAFSGIGVNYTGVAYAVDSSNRQGIAAGYHNDSGIAADPQVIFADNFESWKNGTEPPTGKWSVRRNDVSRTSVVPGSVEKKGSSGPGKGVLEIACWTPGSGSQTGGLNIKLGNYNNDDSGLGDGYDEIYIRYYIKFDSEYRAVRNHGANLGGRDLKMDNAAWVGMAAVRDVSTRGYFYSGVQPRGELGGTDLEMGFYSYHLDKHDQWGENYEVQQHIPITVGKWYCIERHMKLNSVDSSKADPAVADGIEELWIDGRLSIRREGVRFRRVPSLHISFFSLETYYHGLPEQFSREHPIKVYYDNAVFARKYIGPLNLP